MKSTLIYEEWKPIKNYEGLYDVSNFGHVRSLNFKHTNKIKIMALKYTYNGYLRINLRKNKIQKSFLVHRLVYETFNGEIPKDMQVNHINEIKTDNSVWNLNLMTPKENTNWGTGIERRSDTVLQLTLNGELVKEWASMTEAAKNGFKIGCISLCCQEKIKTHKGFKWVKKNPA